MDYTEFFEWIDRVPEPERKWAVAFRDSLQDAFQDGNYEDFAEVYTLFYGKGTGLSKAQFYRKKKYIVEFYRWLSDKGAVSEDVAERVASLSLEDIVSEAEIETFFFKDLSSMIGYITFVGSTQGLGGENDLLMLKSLAVLSWYSIDLHEMISLKINDIDVFRHVVHIKEGNKRSVQIDKLSTSILIAFANTSDYKGFPSGKIQHLRQSPYLFRSVRGAMSTENNLSLALKRFNAVAARYGHLLKINSLKKNGIFCEVLKHDDGKSTIGLLITKLCGQDRQMAFGYAQYYKLWKKRFREEATS